MQPFGSYFHVCNRRVAPCSLLASGAVALVSELHHLNGIRESLVLDSKGQEGCCTSGGKAAKWKRAMLNTLSYTCDRDRFRCGSALCWTGPFLTLKLWVLCACFLLALPLHLSLCLFNAAYTPDKYILSTNKTRDVDDCCLLSSIC